MSTDLTFPGTGALTGDVHASPASSYTYGSDLDWVLEQIDGIDPVDLETVEITETMRVAHRALAQVRAEILRRKAVQAGSQQVDYCGVDGDYGRACGPDLGLPSCAYHSRIAIEG
ncbi:hypothetical protein [Plantactinospora sp. WMMB782]|uniref:hypothetical protein n=1 Tax=Plantactinospora sp. WMMB782 TaxID=3404121 RepID=UPI003B922FB3